MEIFKNKFLVKLIAFICLFLTLFNFAGPGMVYAAGDDDDVWGGVLINPIVKLMRAIGDAIMEILHSSAQSQGAAIIKINGAKEWYEKLADVIAVVVGIVVAVIVIGAIVATGGLVGAAAAAIASGTATFTVSISATTLLTGTVVGVCAGVAIREKMIPDDIYLPAFSITAEEIFSDRLPLFDVNFFKPGKYGAEVTKTGEKTITWDKKVIFEQKLEKTPSKNEETGKYDPEWAGLPWSSGNNIISGIWEDNSPNGGGDGLNGDITQADLDNYDWDNWGSGVPLDWAEKYPFSSITNLINQYQYIEGLPSLGPEGVRVLAKGYEIVEQVDGGYNVLGFKKRFKFYNSDKTMVFTVDLSHPPDGKNTMPTSIKITRESGSLKSMYQETVYEEISSTATKLSGIVSKWYFILRNMAILVLMLLLIYSGIRIVIGSTAGEKAKYKERIIDWIVALCLVMIMHYIMFFAVELVEKITLLVSKTGVNGNAAVIYLTQDQKENADKVLGDFYAKGIKVEKDDSGNWVLAWPTDLAGLFYIESQMTDEGTSKWVGYTLSYVVLVLFTLFFAFTYLRRVIYMAFLTMIAPLVAMTYPIDKITDGKAQAFDAWLKEYIFNLMIQPLHLLLYTLLVSSAYTLVTENPIYSLVALGFMMPAEKLMRKFFGFEKAKTPGLLGGAAGAAIAMTGLQSIMKPKHHGGHDGRSGNNKDQNKVKFANKNNVNTMEAVAGGAPIPGGSGAAEAAQQAAQKVKVNKVPKTASNSAGAKVPKKQVTATPSGGANSISTFAQTNAARSAYNKKPVATTNTSNSTNGKGRSALRGGGALIKGVSKQMAGRVLSGIHPVKWAGQIAAGATLGTAGLLLGIASGDPSKAFQYTTAGMVGGSALVGAMSNNQLLDGEQLKEETEMAYYGSEYKDAVVERQRDQFTKNKSNINYIRQTMGVSEKEAKEILETTGGECFDNGITSVEDIATIHKLTNGKDAMSFEQAVAARNYAKKRLPSDPDQMTEKSVRQYKARWEEEYREAGYANAHDLSEKSFDLAIRYNKAQSSLTKNP